MKRLSIPTLLLVSLAALGGCDQDRAMSERGFRLPEGNATAGRETFLYMHCNQCHTINGEELPTVAGFEPFVELGGSLTRVKTYGELVTAIINPSHNRRSSSIGSTPIRTQHHPYKAAEQPERGYCRLPAGSSP
jgi:mono/diheme cytochrome c family protein